MITLFDQDWLDELEKKRNVREGKIQDARNLIAKGIVTFAQLEKSDLYTADELSAIAARN